MPPNYLWLIAAGAAWNTVLSYENIRLRQQQPLQAFTADVPAKLNSSQLRRRKPAMVVVASGVCSHIGTVSQAVPAAGSLAAYENQA